MTAPEQADAERAKRGVGTGGRFMVLTRARWRTLWAAPTANRMNLVLAYLVMLAGTGADHRLTKWSVAAIAAHTGMRKEAGRVAVDELIEGGLAARAPAWTKLRPQYELAPLAEDPERDEEPIFLPVALVTGLLQGDASMLRRVRETGDPLALRLLIDLYGQVTTDAPYAVALSAIRVFFDGQAAQRVSEVGVHAVWAVEAPNMRQTSLGASEYAKPGEVGDFWTRLACLTRIGACYYEPWLFSSADADADPIFPLRRDAKVIDFAGAAADALTEEHQVSSAIAQMTPEAKVVLPAHHQPPAIQEVLKMRVEADTPGRRAAYGERSRLIEHWIGEYQRLADEAGAGTYDNPLRTAA